MRKLLSYVSILLGAGMLTGCHGSNYYDLPKETTVQETTVSQESQAQTSKFTFDENKKIEINFWAKNDTNKTQTEVYANAKAEFEKLYPNVTVNIKLYTDYSRIYNDVITNISTNTTPNVCITYPDHIATYMTGKNIIVNLDDYYTDSEYGLGGSLVKFDSPGVDEVVPKFLNECMIDGHYYALPFMRSTEACYVNKTMVEQLGYTLPETLTWDFVWEVSEAAMAKNADGTYKINGQNVLIPFIYKSTDNMMITMLKQLGAGYSKSNGEVLIFNDDTKNILYTVSEHVKSGAFSTFKISSYPGNFFNAGQCIFAIDSTAGATWIGAQAPLHDIDADQMIDFETVVMAVPQFDTSNPQMISQGPSVCVFEKDDSDEVMASWLFAQFLLTNEIQIPYSQSEGYIPVTLKAQRSAEYVDYLNRRGEDGKLHYSVKIDAAKLLLDNIDNSFVTPVFNGSTSLRDAAGQLIEDTAKATRRKQTIDEAFMSKTFSDIVSRCKLDQIVVKPEPVIDNGQQENGTVPETAENNSTLLKELGGLPGASVALIVGLCVVWSLIGAYAVFMFIKKKKSARNR